MTPAPYIPADNEARLAKLRAKAASGLPGCVKAREALAEATKRGLALPVGAREQAQ